MDDTGHLDSATLESIPKPSSEEQRLHARREAERTETARSTPWRLVELALPPRFMRAF